MVAGKTARSMSGNSLRQPHIALLVGLVWLTVAGQLIWLDWAETARALGDSDDAMRLVQVREFLAGRGWFDLHEPRLQPPIGYDTHWSRLIDAGLAGLLHTFRSFADVAGAERLTRAIWPMLWIVPAMAGAIAIAWRLGGRAAGLALLFVVVFGLPAFVQFRPGRIDHHAVQIALALLTIAAAIWADRVRWTAWGAGALSGFALAIGVESLPFIVVAGAAFALRYAADRGHAAAMACYGTAVAASAAIAFVISVAPARWTQTACDAIAINLAAPAMLGGIALGVAGQWVAHARISVRLFAVAVALALAAAAFIAIEPRCLSGPLAMVDPAVLPIWLAYVREAQTLIATIRANSVLGLGISAFPAAAAIALIVLAREAQMRRDSGFVIAAAAFIAAGAMMIAAVRALPYALWFGMPLIAAALLRLFERLRLATSCVQLMVALPFTPAVLSFGMIALVETFVAIDPAARNPRDNACLESKSYGALARLPAGLMVADVDYGPFLLALTPHSALAAPYHRMSQGIIESHRAFASPPDQARAILMKVRPRYVMICAGRDPRGLPEDIRAQSLWGRLAAGAIPDWLEPIPDVAPFAVFRFKP
jgi:hypothetical protein